MTKQWNWCDKKNDVFLIFFWIQRMTSSSPGRPGGRQRQKNTLINNNTNNNHNIFFHKLYEIFVLLFFHWILYVFLDFCYILNMFIDFSDFFWKQIEIFGKFGEHFGDIFGHFWILLETLGKIWANQEKPRTPSKKQRNLTNLFFISLLIS